MFKSLLLKGRTMCLLILCTLSSLVVTAQTRITGKVIGSDDKQPVIGATVKIKGTNLGVVTDVNGTFAINAKTNDILVISYIGYLAKQVTVTGPSLGTIVLESTNSTLNEVVVTGYTSQRKKDIAGAVAVVDLNSARKIPASSTDQLLQGQAAGVTVVNQGAPGAGSSVLIRGISNFGNSQPLYVIDGVQGNSMSNLNPNDIESIQVLKDAGAAAIYGVSGGNGVIVITTKRGKTGKSVLSYDAYYGSQVPKGGNVFNTLSPQGMSQLTYLVNDPTVAKALYPDGPGTVPVYGYQGPHSAGVGNSSFDLSQYNFDASNPGNDFLIQKFNQKGTDWFHEIFKAAPEQYHTLTASGANDKNSYYFSVGYLDQQGTEIDTYLKRYETRINTVFNINDHVRVGENAFIYYRRMPQGGFSNQSEGAPLSYAYRMMPQIPVYDISGVQYGGTYDGPGGEPLGNSSNPVAVLNMLNNDAYKEFNINGNIFAEVDFLKHFTAKTAFGGQVQNQYNNGFSTNPYYDYEGHFNANSVYENSAYFSNYNWTNTVLYKQIFGKHNVSVLGGYEQSEFVGRTVGGNGTNLFSVDPNYVNVSNATKNTVPFSGAFTPNSRQSLFARLDYIYNDKYILGATIRRDGYSAFYPGRQWGTFPSVSLAWRISQEDFLKSVSWLNDLKLRASYGVAGNNTNIDPANPYLRYGGSFGNGYYAIGGTNATSQGFINTNLGNTKTTWETDRISNIGIDATIFNKVDLSVEFYKKTISGLLFRDQVPATVGGASPPFVNIGDVQNKGIDVAATYHGTAGSDFRYNIGVNVTAYKNLITKIPGNYFDDAGTRVNPIVRQQVGQPIGEFFGYKVIGFYSAADIANPAVAKYPLAQEGSFKYADVNSDGAISDKDRTFIGNPNPDFTYGVNLSATYKNFDFSMVLYGSQGNKDFHYTLYFTDFYGSFQGGKSNDALYKSYGSPYLKGAPTLPIASDNNSMGTTQISSFYVENGSFLKCRVAQLGYSFTPALLKTIGITKLHLYVQATNLFTITKYTGLDPELPPVGSNSLGTDFGNYPSNQKQYIVGVNMSF